MNQEISEIYRVFRPYRLGPDFAGCSHCVDPADTEHLANTELCNLTLADLDSYSFRAMTTWGEVRHFKHFLPRLLEIASTDYDRFLSAEVLFGKLCYGKWDDWPDWEHRAVYDFLHAFWKSVISAEVKVPDDNSVDTVLCAIGNACKTIEPFLLEWTSSSCQAAPRQLAQFVLLNSHDVKEHRRLANAYWSGRSDQAMEVLEWLRLPATYEYLYDNESNLDSRLAESVARLAAL